MSQAIISAKMAKLQKVKHSLRYATEIFSISVNCQDPMKVYAWQYSDITQKPHDHLLKKSE